VNVSVVIPAHNAAATIAETIESLRDQTCPNWEAIVVDDGSRDETATIAARFAERDARIRIVNQPQMGVSAARNTGISLAHFDWLLFLDADDWLLPPHLERLTGALISDSDLDAVHCGWARVAPDGTLVGEKYWPGSGDLFAPFARTCAFAIHACIVRRSLVEAVGGFDTSLRTCEDWDLWQRIARTGARFGAIHEALARYRMRPDAASLGGPQLLADALRVITQGHSFDRRVPNPHPAHRDGLPAELLSGAKLLWVCWAAGLVLGRGEDARPLLDALQDDRDPGLNPTYVAASIFEAVPIVTCRVPGAWDELWPALEQHIDAFLLALEEQAQASGLARRTRTVLERLVLKHAMASGPLTIGATHAVRVEVMQPISDIVPPAAVERLQCVVELEGVPIGRIELPVCEGLVPGYVLADAIAAEFFWPILGQFFEGTVYRDLRVEREPGGLSLWRGALYLVAGLAEDERAFWTQAHDRVGWTIFLQEIWGRPEWPNEVFYDSQAVEEAAPYRRVDDGWLVIEVSQDLPDIEFAGQSLDVVLTVGGVALGVVSVPVKENIVRAHELRVALTAASGLELCRAAVREGLLGWPIAGPGSLRTRLAAAAVVAGGDRDGPVAGAVTDLALRAGEVALPVLAPGLAGALSRALSPGERGMVLGRRAGETMGTSASRRASLPAAAAHALIHAASTAGEPVIHCPGPGEQPERIVYAPDLIVRPLRRMPAPATDVNRSGAVRPADVPGGYRNFFETLFVTQPDPWGYTSRSPEVIEPEQPTPLPPEVATQVFGDGGSPQRHGASGAVVTERLPILMYHRIVPTVSPVTARCRVTPAAFEEQLRYLHAAGFYSVGLEAWRAAMEVKKPLPGRAVHITFDDGYLDFLTHAWPLLKQYGFSATVFLVADAIGQSNHWDRVYGEESPLLGWEELHQLQNEGVEFGSHSASHRPLSALSPEEVVCEAARSRAILERGLGTALKAFAYPYGDVDPVVQHFIGACGYTFGLSHRPGLSRFQDALLALPRIEVTGSDSLQDFIARLKP
jgi:peptidoglycan/xylan/chitin deacetylase (PgdA/CDA1 family)